jgi:signal recognition particle receptor subunit beta
VLASDFALLHGEFLNAITDQETGALIETNDRKTQVKRQTIEPQYLLHLRDKSGVDLTDTPGLFQMRLEFVFLSISLTALCETAWQ